MTDITKCTGYTEAIICPAKDSCYRYTSHEGSYQSYFIDIPYKNGSCDMYWGKNADSIFNQLKTCHENPSNT
jgi:hypothetical protein